jgi:hypothetical protein
VGLTTLMDIFIGGIHNFTNILRAGPECRKPEFEMTMRKHLPNALCVSLVLFFAATVVGQVPRSRSRSPKKITPQTSDSQSQQPDRTIVEDKTGKPASDAVPEECLSVTRAFIAYISHEKPDITIDKQAQSRWLSADLNKGLANRMDVYRKFVKVNGDNPDGPPGNGDFVGTWDYPTTYSIAGSRRYSDRVMVDIVFTWGEKTEYAGDTRLVTYAFVQEGGAWKLDDIYTFRGKFVSATSLSATFSSNTYP